MRANEDRLLEMRETANKKELTMKLSTTRDLQGAHENGLMSRGENCTEYSPYKQAVNLLISSGPSDIATRDSEPLASRSSHFWTSTGISHDLRLLLDEDVFINKLK